MSSFLRHQRVAHAIGPAGRLTLRLQNADVRLTGVEAERAEVVATFEITAGSDGEATRVFQALQLRISESAGALTVEQHGEPRGGLNSVLDGSQLLALQLEVTLPRHASVLLETVSGDVSATDLHGEQRYSTVSGDLYIVRCSGTVRVNTVSGDARLEAEGPLTLRAESVSGDVEATTPRFEALRVATVSGDVDLEGALRADGEFRIETVSGDVAVGPVGGASFEVRGLSTEISSDLDHRVEGRSDRRRVSVEGGGPELIFSSMSGDFHVRRARRADAAAPPDDDAGPEAAVRELAVLRALERGEIDVEEAARRLDRQ